jgi:hypothetical protein
VNAPLAHVGCVVTLAALGCANGSNASQSDAQPPARPAETAGTAAGRPGGLVFAAQGRWRVLDPATAQVTEVAHDPLPEPPLPKTIVRDEFQVTWGSGAPSPDGRRTAWTLSSTGRPACQVGWTDARGSALVVVNPTGFDNRWPLWTHDGQQLLFAARDAEHAGYRVMAHDVATREESPWHDRGMLLLPRPVLDRGRWIHQRTRIEEGRRVFDLAVIPATEGAVPEVLIQHTVQAHQLMLAPDETLWVCGHRSLWWFDLAARRLRHSWLEADLLPGASGWHLGQCHMRADGRAVAVELLPDEWPRFGGVSTLGVVFVEVVDAATEPSLRRFSTAQLGFLRGFVPETR